MGASCDTQCGTVVFGQGDDYSAYWQGLRLASFPVKHDRSFTNDDDGAGLDYSHIANGPRQSAANCACDLLLDANSFEPTQAGWVDDGSSGPAMTVWNSDDAPNAWYPCPINDDGEILKCTDWYGCNQFVRLVCALNTAQVECVA